MTTDIDDVQLLYYDKVRFIRVVLAWYHQSNKFSQSSGSYFITSTTAFASQIKLCFQD